jgi:leader peptidase (prepilin peptidase)/N-methyltransferase
VNADLAALPHWFVYAVAAFFGGCFGSFLNVCVGRWPKELSVIRPPSRCPRCGAGIAWYDNIPVLSWFALRGKCRGCGLPISPVYPLVELVVAMIWVGSAMHFGPSLTALRFAMFCTVLLGVMLTDAAAYVIPDGFTVFGLVWAIAMSMFAYVRDDVSVFAGPGDAVLGACVGAGAIAIIGWFGEMLLKKEAMGFGDVTLMAMVGAHLGPGPSLLTIFLGAAVGAAIFILIVLPIAWVRSKRTGTPYDPPLVPFGIFLAPGAVIALLWGTDLIRWYRSGVMGL